MKKTALLTFLFAVGLLICSIPASAATTGPNSIVITLLDNNSNLTGGAADGSQTFTPEQVSGYTISGITFELYATKYTVGAPGSGQTQWTSNAPIPAESSVLNGIVATGVTDGNGVLTFSNLPNGVYYVVESESNSNLVGNIIQPFYINLPYTSTDGSALNTVYVYPKNITQNDRMIEITKLAGNAPAGQILVSASNTDASYTATALMPKNILQVTNIYLDDVIPNAFSYNLDSLTMSLGSTVIPMNDDSGTAYYTAQQAQAGVNNELKINFTSAGLTYLQNLVTASGVYKLNISYTVAVPEGLTAGQIYENTITAYTTDANGTMQTSDTADLVTGSLTLTQQGVDSSGSTVNLKGVVYALLDENKNPIMLNNTGSTAWQETTDENGQLQFTGLGPGTYYIQQISLGTSNNSYAIDPNTYEFTIAVPNASDAAQGTTGTAGVVTDGNAVLKIMTLTAHQQAILPVTGGKMIVIAAAAIVAIGIGFVLLNKKNIKED